MTADFAIAREVDELTVEVPSSFLASGLEIIDTPGIEASGVEGQAHAAVTQRVVRDEADAAIVLIPADAPMTRSLIDFLEGPAAHFLHRCLFVITKVDHVPEAERTAIVDFVRSKLASILGGPVELYESAAVTAVPTKGPIPARLLDDWERWRARFEELRQSLESHVAARRGVIVCERLARLLGDSLAVLNEDVVLRATRLEREEADLERNSTERLDTTLSAIGSECVELLNAAAERCRQGFVEAAQGYFIRSMSEVDRLLAEAEWETLTLAVKEQIPAAIAAQQAEFEAESEQLLQELAETREEAHELIATEFRRRYQALQAIGMDASAGGDASMRLTDLSVAFTAAGGFVETSDSDDGMRGMLGGGGLALVGFLLGGPVGALLF
ncbi:MAG TPA: dynamin family protein, partial [Pirellulaceae bacterium]|nr:dynamin family protein [Pirellulaceae bacterium]